MSALLGVSVGTVHRRFANGAPLVRSGLVSIDNDGDLIVVSRLHRIATVPGETSVDVHRLLLPSAPASELEWSDFDHIARDRDHVERLLAGAIEAGAPGVNILLHGPPGTGKTELCKDSRSAARAGSARRDAARRVRRQAESTQGNRVSAIGESRPTSCAAAVA